MFITDHSWNGFWTALRDTGKWKSTWQPSEQDESDWRRALDIYDAELLDKARRIHRDEQGRYRQPNLGKFIITVKSIAGDRYKDNTRREAVYWLCYDKGSDGAIDIGSPVEMYYTIDSHNADRQTERISKYLTEKYGGRWISMHTSLPEARRKGHILKHEAGVCIKGHCRVCDPVLAEKIEGIDTMPKLIAFLGKTGPIGKPVPAIPKVTESSRLTQVRSLAKAVVTKTPETVRDNGADDDFSF